MDQATWSKKKTNVEKMEMMEARGSGRSLLLVQILNPENSNAIPRSHQSALTFAKQSLDCCYLAQHSSRQAVQVLVKNY